MFSLLLPFLPRPPMILSTTARPTLALSNAPAPPFSPLPSPPLPHHHHPSLAIPSSECDRCATVPRAGLSPTRRDRFPVGAPLISFADFCQLCNLLAKGCANMFGSGKKMIDARRVLFYSLVSGDKFLYGFICRWWSIALPNLELKVSSWEDAQSSKSKVHVRPWTLNCISNLSQTSDFGMNFSRSRERLQRHASALRVRIYTGSVGWAGPCTLYNSSTLVNAHRSILQSMYAKCPVYRSRRCIATFICYFPLAIAAEACAKSIYIKSIRARRGEALGGSSGKKFENAHWEMSTSTRRVRGEYRKNGAKRKTERERERGGGRRGGILFRTAKLNYQIKQQRRYINKIDFARRSSKGHASAPSFRRLTLFRATPRFNHVARRLKRSLFIFVINPTSRGRARARAFEQWRGRNATGILLR